MFAAFLHFDLSFMIWVLLGALGVSISESLGLSAAQKGLMVAIPILSGSLMRIPLGLLSDRFGGRRVGIAMLLALFVPLLVGWRAGTSLGVLIGVGLMLGVAGASFAVVLPLASRWYPPERQGLVMGIAAAGNSGTVVANLVAPRDRRDGRLAQRARADDDPARRSCWSCSPRWRRTARRAWRRSRCRATSPRCASASCGGSACSTA